MSEENEGGMSTIKKTIIGIANQLKNNKIVAHLSFE